MPRDYLKINVRQPLHRSSSHPKGPNLLATGVLHCGGSPKSLCIHSGDGGGRGPRTKPTLSRGNEWGGLASDTWSIDDPIQAEGLSSINLKPVIFAERVEFELFRDLELRLDLDPYFDFELNRDVERGSVEPSCDVFSQVVEYSGALDSHE